MKVIIYITLNRNKLLHLIVVTIQIDRQKTNKNVHFEIQN